MIPRGTETEMSVGGYIFLSLSELTLKIMSTGEWYNQNKNE